MRRLAIISLVTALVAVGAVGAAWGWLFWTPPGRQSLKGLIEREIADAIGGQVEIARLSGALPDDVIFEEMKFSFDGSAWLQINRAEIAWSPVALLRKQISIKSVSIASATLRASPPERDDPDKRIRGFQLPGNLPNIEIGELQIDDFRVAAALAGAEARLDGAGHLHMGGRKLDILLNATGDADKDFVSIRALREDDALSIDTMVRSTADGVISTIAKNSGPLFVEAKGTGPLADYELSYEAAFGAYGDASGAIAGNLEEMQAIEFQSRALLGAKFENTKNIVGPELSVAGVYAPSRDGGSLNISDYRSALGAAKGVIIWRNSGDTLDRIDIDASARLDENWRPDIRRYIGDDIAARGTLTSAKDEFIVTADIDATYFDAALKSMATDLKDYLRGSAVIALKQNPNMPEILAQGGEAFGEFDLAFGDSIGARKANLKTAEGGEFNGEASYAFDSRAFTVKGDASMSPTMAASYDSRLAFRNDISGVIDLKGDIDHFGGAIVATFPSFNIDKAAFPPSRVSLALADAPHAAAGQITLRALDDSRRAAMNFARAGGGWRLSGIDYSGKDFALKGSAAFANDIAALDIAYRGLESAEPWPGVSLVGDFTVKGEIGHGRAANDLKIQSERLASRDWFLSALSVTAKGPSGALKVSANAKRIEKSGLSPFDDVAADFTAALGAQTSLKATKLSAKIAGEPLKLTAPAEILLGEEIAVKGFRSAVGKSGALSIDGAFSKSRWRGKIAADRAPIFSAASTVDLALDLDTDRIAPASGAARISSMLTKTDQASVSLTYVWDGKALKIKDDDSDEKLDLNLSIPLRLTRTPALSVKTDGPLRGEASYAGRLETLAGFLPVALQSLEGALSFDGALSGTLARPSLSGAVTVEDGAYTELATGLSIVNVKASANAAGTVDGSTITFNAAGGGVNQKTETIFADGTIRIGAGGNLRTRIRFDGAKLSAGPVNEVEATGAVDLSGPFDNLRAEGEVTVKSLDARVFTPDATGLVDINVVEINGDGSSVPAAISHRPTTNITYALHIIGDDRIFIRGRGLESEWKADVNVEGRAEAPVIIGALDMKDGEITFAGRRFRLSKGAISFDRLSVNNPALDIRAERETRNGTQTEIVIEGRAEAPKISLSSTPSLPQEDIMALILFDKPANELSAIESLQVAEGLAELGGIGPFGGNGVTGSARQALGLDLLNVNIDQADSAASSLTVGKYVADGLFVTATQDARGENGSVRVEYEINDAFTVETELRQDGDQKASVNWKHDF